MNYTYFLIFWSVFGFVDKSLAKNILLGSSLDLVPPTFQVKRSIYNINKKLIVRE
jgi:hypothetical protein